MLIIWDALDSKIADRIVMCVINGTKCVLNVYAGFLYAIRSKLRALLRILYVR